MNTIKKFNLDTSNLHSNGEDRSFSITGDNGSIFSLEVKNQAGYYYNFYKRTFQLTPSRLRNINIENQSKYRGTIKFPELADTSVGITYDFYLFAEQETVHADYREVRSLDGTIDINLTRGSDSNLVRKVLHQTPSTTLAISAYSPNSTVSGTTSTFNITTSIDQPLGITPFSFTYTSASLETYGAIKQPTASDIMSFLTLGAGDPIAIPGENIYPTQTANLTVAGTSSTAVTMVASIGSNIKIGDKLVGQTSPPNVVTVESIDSDKVFTTSEAIDIPDGENLLFYNARYHRWNISDVSKIEPGMIVQAGTNFWLAAQTVKEYLTQFTVLEGEENEYNIDNVRIPAIDGLGNPVVISRNVDTKIQTISQKGAITFSGQAALAFGETDFSNTNARIYAYGISAVKRLTGYDVEFTDLKMELTATTSLTTSSPSNATTFNIASARGIADDISTISGIGVTKNADGSNPLITNITNVGGATWNDSGAATITVSPAQTLETGVLLTFSEASPVVTISGNIKINKAGSNGGTLRFDIEKLIKTL